MSKGTADQSAVPFYLSVICAMHCARDRSFAANWNRYAAEVSFTRYNGRFSLWRNQATKRIQSLRVRVRPSICPTVKTIWTNVFWCSFWCSISPFAETSLRMGKRHFRSVTVPASVRARQFDVTGNRFFADKLKGTAGNAAIPFDMVSGRRFQPFANA